MGARRRIEAVRICRRMGRVRVAEMTDLGNIGGDSVLMGLLDLSLGLLATTDFR